MALHYSPWTSASDGVSRKRQPTLSGMRKTVKNQQSSNENAETSSSSPPFAQYNASSEMTETPETVTDHIEKQNERATKINSILNKITSFETNDKLGDFNPMPYPTNITKRNSDQILPADEQVEPGINPLMPKTGKPVFDTSAKPVYYRPSDSGKSEYANYRTAYGKEGFSEPYYSKMGIGKSGDKMMDRLNYMTQMLESIQMEKTNHVTEEFILYSLLGVFMIYIIDGFSRGGKYVR
jgi:hypothetical protein